MYQDRALNGRTLRCAIYTRKSSERGLQQDFNSLKAQQAICSAYIQSQQHKGWTEIDKVYEDAAQSGATLDRLDHESRSPSQRACMAAMGGKRTLPRLA